MTLTTPSGYGSKVSGVLETPSLALPDQPEQSRWSIGYWFFETREPPGWFGTPEVSISDPMIWESQGGAGTGLNRVLREPLTGPDIEVWAEASGLSGGYIRLVARWDENYLRFQLGSEPELPPIPPRPRPRAETTHWRLTKAGAIAPGTEAGGPVGTLAQGDVPLVDHDRGALRIESGVIRCDIESFGVVWEGTDPDIPNGAGKVGLQTDGVSLIAFGAGSL